MDAENQQRADDGDNRPNSIDLGGLAVAPIERVGGNEGEHSAANSAGKHPVDDRGQSLSRYDAGDETNEGTRRDEKEKKLHHACVPRVDCWQPPLMI
jgi:hypothetical protein